MVTKKKPIEYDLDDVDLARRILINLGHEVPPSAETVSGSDLGNVAALIAQARQNRRLQEEAIEAATLPRSSIDRATALVLEFENEHKAALALLKEKEAAVDSWRWGYTYLQDRMNSIERHGWAHDCDGEIDYRINSAQGKP